MKKVLGLIAALMLFQLGFAQVNTEYVDEPKFERTQTVMLENNNQHSVRPVHGSDVMWQKRLWRAVDLREKQNKGLFAHGNEISRLLVDAIMKGKIKAYGKDSIDDKHLLTIKDFRERMRIPQTEILEPDSFDIEPWETDWPEDNPQAAGPAEEFYFPNQLYQMEIVEDLIFDKQESRNKYDIQHLTFFIPADIPENIRGIQQHLFTVSYKDCYNLFARQPVYNWFNRENDGQHRNLADAFDLRLFHAYIIKVSNPDDLYLEDVYGTPEAGIQASKDTEMQLLEFEHNLWEL